MDRYSRNPHEFQNGDMADRPLVFPLLLLPGENVLIIGDLDVSEVCINC